MNDSLEELWSRLSLTEEEQDVVAVEKEWVEDVSAVGNKCLLGKLLIRRNVNIEAMRNVFLKIWRLKSGMTIREVGERRFLFYFEDALEKDKVFQKQPWSFNKSLMVLNEFDGHTQTENVNMEWCAFNVQIHGLPLNLMNEKIGVVLGESIGEVEDVECDEKQVAWGRYLKVRVSINTSKSLKRGKMLSVPGGGRVLAMFRYEHLPDFCYVCGRLDHQEQDCEAVVRLKKEGKKAQRDYGAWLRAEGPAFSNSKERMADSRSVGENFSSMPLGQKGEQKSSTKDREVNSGENNNEMRRKGSHRGVQEASRWSEGQRSIVREGPVDQGGKKEKSNPEKDSSQQLLSRKSCKVTESNTISKVNELAGNLNMVDLCYNNSEIKGLMEETGNGGNKFSSSNTTRKKRLSTWKRAVRSNMSKTQASGVSSRVYNRKRGFNNIEEVGLKKLKESNMIESTEVYPSKAEDGESQPRRSL